MQYIVLDMEWNQPWPGSYSAKKPVPSPLRGEIVQIGAVRMLEDQTVADEFQVLIRPKYYKKMNRKVASLTGIKDAQLKTEGIGFEEAIARFQDWCKEPSVFLIWGFDDIGILKENLALYQLPDGWLSRWYNAQLIFNAQTDGSSAQKALRTAMELMQIEPTRPAHDALGDAYHTAQICSRLRLQEGIESYDHALRHHENGLHGVQLEGCLGRRVYHGYQDRTEAVAAMSTRENLCPVCGKKMQCGRWYPQPGKRLLTMAKCAEHGTYYVRIRLVKEEDGSTRVSRLVYDADSDVAQSYQKLQEKPHSRRKRRRKVVRTKSVMQSTQTK